MVGSLEKSERERRAGAPRSRVASTDSVDETIQIPCSRKTALISLSVSCEIFVQALSVNLSRKLVTVAGFIVWTGVRLDSVFFTGLTLEGTIVDLDVEVPSETCFSSPLSSHHSTNMLTVLG